MTVIAAAPNVRAQILGALKADAPLVALLADGVASIFPRIKVDPARSRKPFIFWGYEGGGPRREASPDIGIWKFAVHDYPVNGLWTVDRIIDRIRWIYNGATWEPATETLPAYWSQYAGSSGELVDPGWSTIFRIARVQVTQS